MMRNNTLFVYAMICASLWQCFAAPVQEKQMGSSRCEGSAEYMLQLNFAFSAATHPLHYPEGGLQTPVVAATHNTDYVPWRPLTEASPGVELVAEEGATGLLQSEIEAQIEMNNAGEVAVWPNGPVPNDGEMSVTLTATPGYPYLTFINMIAPSNDWFTGDYNVNLCEDGEWVSTLSGDLIPWDAGTEQGPVFSFDGFPEDGVIERIFCGEAFNECPQSKEQKGMGMGMGMGMSEDEEDTDDDSEETGMGMGMGMGMDDSDSDSDSDSDMMEMPTGIPPIGMFTITRIDG